MAKWTFGKKQTPVLETSSGTISKTNKKASTYIPGSEEIDAYINRMNATQKLPSGASYITSELTNAVLPSYLHGASKLGGGNINLLTGEYGGGGGGGDGGGGGSYYIPSGGGTTPITWSEKLTATNAPNWWKGLVPSQITEENVTATMLNALIPYMSPEDQRTAATALYSAYPDTFANPETIKFSSPPVSLSTTTKDYFTSSSRAKDALSILGQVATATKTSTKDMGAGYQFLRNVLDIMQEYGGKSTSNKQTRSQFVQQQAALSALYDQAPSDTYKALAQNMAAPAFSAGNVVPITTDSDGNYIFGEVNRRIF